MDMPLKVADREFSSRLIVGTGKYEDNPTMVEAIRATGAEMVTVAVRRIDLDRTKEEGILYHLDPKEFLLLPNTAGCYTAEDAIRYARLGRAAGFTDWLKLEIIGDQETLLPDTHATIEAAKVLVGEGFKIMAYTKGEITKRSAKQLTAFAGLAPAQRQSGTSLQGQSRIDKQGCAPLRITLYMCSLSAADHNPELKPLYQRLTTRKNNPLAKKQARVAVMRKLLLIARAVLISGKPFNRNFIAAKA